MMLKTKSVLLSCDVVSEASEHNPNVGRLTIPMKRVSPKITATVVVAPVCIPTMCVKI